MRSSQPQARAQMKNSPLCPNSGLSGHISLSRSLCPCLLWRALWLPGSCSFPKNVPAPLHPCSLRKQTPGPYSSSETITQTANSNGATHGATARLGHCKGQLESGEHEIARRKIESPCHYKLYTYALCWHTSVCLDLQFRFVWGYDKRLSERARKGASQKLNPVTKS